MQDGGLGDARARRGRPRGLDNLRRRQRRGGLRPAPLTDWRPARPPAQARHTDAKKAAQGPSPGGPPRRRSRRGVPGTGPRWRWTPSCRRPRPGEARHVMKALVGAAQGGDAAAAALPAAFQRAGDSSSARCSKNRKNRLLWPISNNANCRIPTVHIAGNRRGDTPCVRPYPPWLLPSPRSAVPPRSCPSRTRLLHCPCNSGSASSSAR